ncbi:MAG: hypothetical protein NTW07_11740, partial [candidate division Zixibacteria bacterium]|nr:hypothetical protein [candidate division Zixibacteria bacterium]
MKITLTMRIGRQLCYGLACSAGLPVLWGVSALGRESGVAHSQGNIQLVVGAGGWGFIGGLPGAYFPFVDPITRDTIYGCVYPRESGNMFIYGSLFVGAVLGRDTIVARDINWSTDTASGQIWKIAGNDPSQPYYSPTARSDLDLECKFTDTIINNHGTITWPPWDTYQQIPLGLVGVQKSMAWAGARIDDFVLFDYEMTNMGDRDLESVYVGMWCVSYGISYLGIESDNLTGYLPDYLSPDGCDYVDTLRIAYGMDNDGDPTQYRFTSHSRRGAVGVMLLGASSPNLKLGYNWLVWNADWTQAWGPRRRGTDAEPFRSFGSSLAWPGSDRNLYYIMSHPHIAYDQMFSGVDHYGWLSPWGSAADVATGWPYEMMYTFGPFDLPRREKIKFTLAVVGGDNVYTDPTAHFNPHYPQEYYDQLDFSELAQNARWAQWVYDNPGVDTDSDGYAGEFRVCEGDTIWYKGDGVPDFRGNSPPPIPFTRYETEPGRIIVRWNGFLSETTKDIFSGLIDFEGYRVYCGLDNRRTSLSLLSSYDKENWFRLKYHQLGVGDGRWINDDPPYSLDSLRIIHNDPDLNPDRYTRDRPLIEGDSAFYFAPVDANMADLSSMTGIHKVYPDATNPGRDSTLWTESDITTEHGRKLPKYYEYEYIIDKLLPTVPYFVAVTVFDFGYSGGRGNLPPDETNPLSNCTEVYAQTSSEVVEQENLDVIVYPNPYLADA